MKKKLKALKNSKYFWLLLIVSIFFLPAAIIAPPEAESRAIVSTLGIDKVGEEIQITAQIFSPKASATYTENYEIKSAKDKDIVVALENIGVGLGKRIGLSNLECIVFGKDMTDNIAPYLDFISRGSFIGNHVILIKTDHDAKDFIEAVNERSKKEIFQLTRFATFNESDFYKSVVNLQSFLNGYYGPTKTSACSYIKLKESESSESGDSGNTSSESSSNTSSKKYELDNTSSLSIIRNGKFSYVLSNEERKQLKWFVKQTGQRHIVVDNINDENLTNAEAVFTLKKNKIKNEVYFKDNNPHLKINITAEVIVFSVREDSEEQTLKIKKSYSTTALKNALQEHIKEDVKTIFNFMQAENADIINLYEEFDKNHRKQINKIAKTEKEKSEFISKIQLDDINVNILMKE